MIKAEGTLGSNGIFPMKAGATKSVILVDEKADQKQREALVAFVKDSAGQLIGTLEEVRPVPISLTNDHLEGRGVFKAGDLAEIQTRKMGKRECICTNEIIFYLPLTAVENYSPAYSLVNAYKGEALNSRWVAKNQRNAHFWQRLAASARLSPTIHQAARNPRGFVRFLHLPFVRGNARAEHW